MKYQAIIFDLDGVLCHTDHYHYLAWKKLADMLGIYFDETINDRLRGVSRMESLEIILERCSRTFSPEQKQAYADKKNKFYRELLQQMSPRDLIPEVKQTLDTLRARGIKLGVGSSSKNAGFILHQIGLGEYFDAVCDGNCISHSKPDPEVFVKAAAMLHTPLEYCLVVEDAKAGVQAAVAGGIDCAGIGDAAHCAQAAFGLTTFADLLKIAAT